MSRKLEEFLWFIGVPVATAIANAFISFDPNAITDPKVWAIGLGTQVIRAVAIALGAWVAKIKREGGTNGE